MIGVLTFLYRDILFIGFTIFLWSILITCAEVGPPPGGEKDEVKPYILGSKPENGSVNVPRSDRIVLYFSEQVMSPQAEQPVFISPRQTEKPEFKWENDRLEIVFTDSFDIDETYVVSANSEIADLRNNKLDSAGIIAFSTGASLDTGRVMGQVFSGESPKSGLYVALYDITDLTDSTVYDSLFPAYLTKTNTDGRFNFEYLPPREFRLIAFDDMNQDELFNPSREAFAVTDRPVLLGGEMPLDNLCLSLTSQDTLKPEIISVVYTSNQLLKVRLSRNISLDWLNSHLDSITMTLHDDTSLIYQAHSFLESNLKESSNLSLAFQDLKVGDYQLHLEYDSAFTPLDYSDVVVEKSEDKTAPYMVLFEPDENPKFLDDLEIRMTFSELLDTTRFTPETFSLWQEPDSLLQLEWYWDDDFRLCFSSPDIIENGQYRLVTTEFELFDMSGNAFGDSLSEHHFSTVDPKSLGSISGRVLKHIPWQEEAPVILQFRKIGQQQVTSLSVHEEDFRVDATAGDYLLTAFIDKNSDGSINTGSIYPFRLAETKATYPDTISVRTRFETTGITFDIR